MRALDKLWLDELGVSSVEYAFMLAVISLAGVLAFASVSAEVRHVVDTSSRKMESISGIGCSP